MRTATSRNSIRAIAIKLRMIAIICCLGTSLSSISQTFGEDGKSVLSAHCIGPTATAIELKVSFGSSTLLPFEPARLSISIQNISSKLVRIKKDPCLSDMFLLTAGNPPELVPSHVLTGASQKVGFGTQERLGVIAREVEYTLGPTECISVSIPCIRRYSDSGNADGIDTMSIFDKPGTYELCCDYKLELENAIRQNEHTRVCARIHVTEPVETLDVEMWRQLCNDIELRTVVFSKSDSCPERIFSILTKLSYEPRLSRYTPYIRLALLRVALGYRGPSQPTWRLPIDDLERNQIARRFDYLASHARPEWSKLPYHRFRSPLEIATAIQKWEKASTSYEKSVAREEIVNLAFVTKNDLLSITPLLEDLGRDKSFASRCEALILLRQIYIFQQNKELIANITDELDTSFRDSLEWLQFRAKHVSDHENEQPDVVNFNRHDFRKTIVGFEESRWSLEQWRAFRISDAPKNMINRP